MGTLTEDLIEQVEQVAYVTQLPKVRHLVLPAADLVGNTKYAKFGLLELEDESCGFFYRLAEFDANTSQRTLSELHDRAAGLSGQDPATLAGKISSVDELDVGIGMAALNAITHYVFKRSTYLPAQIAQGADIRKWSESKHLGMIGYFAPTVAYLRQAGIPVTVIELETSLHGESDGVCVTGDTSRLGETDHIICTASTLLNGSLEGLLDEYAAGRFFELVGPTCGCFADVLFSRGVDLIGGSTVIDVPSIRSRVRQGDPWKNSVAKYQITRNDYPGFTALLDTCR